MERVITTKSGHKFRYAQDINGWAFKIVKDSNSKEGDYKAQNYKEDLTSLLQVLLEGVETIGADKVIYVSLGNRFDAESSEPGKARKTYINIYLWTSPYIEGAKIGRYGNCHCGLTPEDVDKIDSEICSKAEQFLQEIKQKD